MAWTTAAAVLALTGETVSEQSVTTASAMIDTKAGVTEDMPADSISTRDRRHLEKATAWQAVYVESRPGLLTETSASTSTSAAGVTDRRDSITATLYHPLTILELRNLSWLTTRTEQVRHDRWRTHHVIDFLNEDSDRFGPWRIP